jgi:serine/threonine-protein kinase
MDRDELIPLPDVRSPGAACSPDGRWVAYRGRDLYRISVDGGPPTKLCDAGFGFGIHWSTDGWIYFTSFEEHGILRVPEGGGDPEVVASVEAADPGAPKDLLFAPHALPGGRTLLCSYVEDLTANRTPEIRAYSLDDGSFKTIITDAAQPHFTRTDHLVFVRDDTLMAAPFSPNTLELTGPAVSIIEGVGESRIFPISHYALSASGTLLYTRASGTATKNGVFAVGPDGETTPLASFAREELSDLRVSPDHRRLAVVVRTYGEGLDSSIWLIDLDRDIPALLTTESGMASEPVWSPNGEWVYYKRNFALEEGVPEGIYRRRADFGGEPELVFETDRVNALRCFDPTGTRLFGIERLNDADPFHSDLITLVLESEPPVIEPWLATPANEFEIALSPNGRWVAYLSTETGRNEIYIRSIRGDRKQRISTDGAVHEPFWSPSGDTLYYQARSDEGLLLQAVKVTSGHEVAEDGSEAPPDTPFDWESAGTVLNVPRDSEDVRMHPGGEGVIMIAPLLEDREKLESFDVHVVLNFIEELKRRAPRRN